MTTLELSQASVAEKVKKQLVEDFPERAVTWVTSPEVSWQDVRNVGLGEIDFARKAHWKAAHHPGKLAKFRAKIKAGDRKPVILVKTPSRPKLIVVDGHHRAYASHQLNTPVRAYVATVTSRTGPWDAMHDLQRASGPRTPGAQLARAGYSEWETRALAPFIIELASFHDHHIPGTPYTYKHGWIPLTGAPPDDAGATPDVYDMLSKKMDDWGAPIDDASTVDKLLAGAKKLEQQGKFNQASIAVRSAKQVLQKANAPKTVIDAFHAHQTTLHHEFLETKGKLPKGAKAPDPDVYRNAISKASLTGKNAYIKIAGIDSPTPGTLFSSSVPPSPGGSAGKEHWVVHPDGSYTHVPAKAPAPAQPWDDMGIGPAGLESYGIGTGTFGNAVSMATPQAPSYIEKTPYGWGITAAQTAASAKVEHFVVEYDQSWTHYPGTNAPEGSGGSSKKPLPLGADDQGSDVASLEKYGIPSYAYYGALGSASNQNNVKGYSYLKKVTSVPGNSWVSDMDAGPVPGQEYVVVHKDANWEHYPPQPKTSPLPLKKGDYVASSNGSVFQVKGPASEGNPDLIYLKDHLGSQYTWNKADLHAATPEDKKEFLQKAKAAAEEAHGADFGTEPESGEVGYGDKVSVGDTVIDNITGGKYTVTAVHPDGSLGIKYHTTGALGTIPPSQKQFYRKDMPGAAKPKTGAMTSDGENVHVGAHVKGVSTSKVYEVDEVVPEGTVLKDSTGKTQLTAYLSTAYVKASPQDVQMFKTAGATTPAKGTPVPLVGMLSDGNAVSVHGYVQGKLSGKVYLVKAFNSDGTAQISDSQGLTISKAQLDRNYTASTTGDINAFLTELGKPHSAMNVGDIVTHKKEGTIGKIVAVSATGKKITVDHGYGKQTYLASSLKPGGPGAKSYWLKVHPEDDPAKKQLEKDKADWEHGLITAEEFYAAHNEWPPGYDPVKDKYDGLKHLVDISGHPAGKELAKSLLSEAETAEKNGQFSKVESKLYYAKQAATDHMKSATYPEVYQALHAEQKKMAVAKKNPKLTAALTEAAAKIDAGKKLPEGVYATPEEAYGTWKSGPKRWVVKNPDGPGYILTTDDPKLPGSAFHNKESWAVDEYGVWHWKPGMASGKQIQSGAGHTGAAGSYTGSTSSAKYKYATSSAHKYAQHYKENVTLPSAEDSAVGAYQDGAYGPINAALRKTDFNPDLIDSTTRNQIKKIDSAIARWSAPDKLNVVRGISQSVKWLPSTSLEGKTVVEPGFSSTSFNTYAPMGGSITMYITVPEGMHGIVMNGRAHSSHPGENELLLPRGTRYVVTKDTGAGGGRTLEVTALPPENVVQLSRWVSLARFVKPAPDRKRVSDGPKRLERFIIQDKNNATVRDATPEELRQAKAQVIKPLELASFKGHHIPGTPYTYRHGWVPLTGDDAFNAVPDANGINDQERHALRVYGEPYGYKIINPVLHHNGQVFDNGRYRPATEKEQSLARWAIPRLDSAFSKASPTTRPMIVNRGTGDVDTMFGPVGSKIGQVFSSKSYTSTTTVPSAKTGFGYGYESKSGKLEIKLPVGSRVLRGNDFEKEVLLPRNAKLRVVSDKMAGAERRIQLEYEPG